MPTARTVLGQILQKIGRHSKFIVKECKLFTFNLREGLSHILLHNVEQRRKFVILRQPLHSFKAVSRLRNLTRSRCRFHRHSLFCHSQLSRLGQFHRNFFTEDTCIFPVSQRPLHIGFCMIQCIRNIRNRQVFIFMAQQIQENFYVFPVCSCHICINKFIGHYGHLYGHLTFQP